MTARTPAGTPPPAARITILDILRALALLGIVIVHTHDHFNLYLPMPPAEGWQAAANSAADWAYEHLFVSKSFLLFSFLFGLSFFIQLDRREQQGIDFRKRFMWRLTLLFLLIKAEHTFQRFLRHRFSTAAAWEKLIFTLHLCMKRGNASSKTPENGNFAASRSGKSK